MAKKIKVALIHNIVAPYRIPLFKALAKNDLLDFKVYFCAETHQHRNWEIIRSNKFKNTLLPGFTLRFRDNYCHFNLSIIKIFFKQQYDVYIIGGGSDFTTQMAFLLSKLFRKPIILWSEGIKKSDSISGKIVEPFNKLVIRKSDAIIVPGTKAKFFTSQRGQLIVRFLLHQILLIMNIILNFVRNIKKIKILLKKK